MGGIMTKAKKLPKEQRTSHIYRRPIASSTPLRRSRIPGEVGNRAIHEEREEIYSGAVNIRADQRVVTTPGAVLPEAGERFVARRNRISAARTKPEASREMVPRTLAQTGVPAPSGSMRAIKPVPRYHAAPMASPIPVRSGQRNTRRRGLLWKILGAFVLLVLVGLGAKFALTSPTFRITQVNVAGTHSTILIEKIQHMGMQGQNIFVMDIAGFTDRIDLLPMVASANLEKQWPNHLLVTVSERQPALLWQTKQVTYSVDKEGVVIAPASETSGTNALMTVVDTRPLGKNSIYPGMRMDAADITFVVTAFARLPHIVGGAGFTLRYDDTLPATLANGQHNPGSYGSYVVESKAGWVAYLGGPNDTNPLDNRLSELQQILALAQQQQINLASVDLRFGLRPVYTVKH
jgi:hypothetical protein